MSEIAEDHTTRLVRHRLSCHQSARREALAAFPLRVANACNDMRKLLEATRYIDSPEAEEAISSYESLIRKEFHAAFGYDIFDPIAPRTKKEGE